MTMRVLLSALAVVLGTHAAAAGNALDKAPFTATGKELIAAAKAAPADAESVVLRHDVDLVVDDSNHVTRRAHYIVLVRTQDAADGWQRLGTTWNGAYQNLPTIRARLIAPTGAITNIDTSKASDDPTDDDGSAIRELSVTVPQIKAGTIIEEEFVIVDSTSLPGGGATYWVNFGSSDGPTLASRMSVTAPAKRVPSIHPRGMPNAKPKRTTAGNRVTWSLDVGALPPRGEYQLQAAGDIEQVPTVIVGTAPSWNAIAKDLGALVDKAIADGGVAVPKGVPTGATAATVQAIARWAFDNVTVRTVDLTGADYSPAPPSATLAARSADSLDVATLLVAVLRKAGIRAQVALVSHGPGPDAVKEVPSIDSFDRALVRATVEGTTMWIDPAEPYATAGQLGAAAQGRGVLVIADETTTIARTPQSTSKDNVIREHRVYTLSENGTADLVETTTETGFFAASQGRFYATSSPADIRKQLATYVESNYDGELVDYHVTRKGSFELVIRARHVGRAYTDRDGIDVYLTRSNSLDRLPDLLRKPDASAPRTVDFQQLEPHRYVIESHLIVPPGFAMPTPAATRARSMGPMTLTEKQRIDGREVVVTFELDTGKLRWTPAEVKAAQDGLAALGKENAVHVRIENIAATHLNADRVPEAIREAQRMIKLHPKDGTHHAQLALIYVNVGAVEAARREARKAVSLQPKDADQYVMLGWILEHDALGRRFGRGYDRAGAKAAFVKARALDPKHLGAANELALLLEKGTSGKPFDRGADATGAAAAWRATYDIDPTPEHAEAYMLALLHAGAASTAVTFARGLERSDARDDLLLAAIAMTRGAADAIHEAATLAKGDDRKDLLDRVAHRLFTLRSYDAMRAVYAETGSLTSGWTEILGRIKRHDKYEPEATPSGAVENLMLAIFAHRSTGVFADAQTEKEIRGAARKAAVASRAGLVGLSDVVLEDTALSLAEAKAEGDEAAWRVELNLAGTRSHAYVAAKKRLPRVIGTDDAPRGVGRYVLDLLAKNDDATAGRVLDWLAADLPAVKQADSTAGAFTAVWSPKGPRTHGAMLLAAAVLAGASAPERVLPIVQKCAASTKEAQVACDLTVAEILARLERWPELLTFSEGWGKRLPNVPYPQYVHASTLVRVGQVDDADVEADALLARNPDDRLATTIRIGSALTRGKLDEAIRLSRSLVGRPTALPSDHNDLAWLELYRGTDIDAARTTIDKARELAPEDEHILHTLAAVEAESGQLTSAWSHGLEWIEQTDDTTSAPLMYLRGRVLEAAGVRDEAIAAYRKAKRTEAKLPIPDSTEFAQKRLKALGARP